MKNLDFDYVNLQKYFESRNWKIKSNEKGLFFYKKGTIVPEEDKVVEPSIKKIDGKFSDLYERFSKITINHFSKRLSNFEKLQPKNIYDSYKNNSFVSTGLEYYYDYLYKDRIIKPVSTLVIQPSIRFKLDFLNKKVYGNNDKYDFSSISFNNISIVTRSMDCDIIEKIEDVLDYFSKVRIHASRVNFVVENKIREKDNDVSYRAIKFFVDNLEVGDILTFKTKNGYLIEYGFGFERLMSRILNKKYRDLFIIDNKYEQETLLGVNFLTLLCMFDNSMQNRGARSKTNEVLNALYKKYDIMNIDLIYENYLYWNQILEESSYQSKFDEVAKKYVRLLRR